MTRRRRLLIDLEDLAFQASHGPVTIKTLQRIRGITTERRAIATLTQIRALLAEECPGITITRLRNELFFDAVKAHAFAARALRKLKLGPEPGPTRAASAGVPDPRSPRKRLMVRVLCSVCGRRTRAQRRRVVLCKGCLTPAPRRDPW